MARPIPTSADTPRQSVKSKLKKGCGIGCAAFGGGVLFILFIGMGVKGTGNDQQPSPGASSPKDATPELTLFNAKPGSACGNAGRVTQVDYGVKTEAILLIEPKKAADPIRIRIGDSELPAPLEEDAAVRELCRMGTWSEVRVLTAPKEFQPLQGWVPTSSLRKVKTNNAGRRVYEVADFQWPAGSMPYRSSVVQVVNRIMDERPDCDAIDTRSLAMTGSGDGVTFSVPCMADGESRSFDFKPADAKNGRSFAPVEAIDKMAAIEACKSAVLGRAAHPSTVDFPTFDYDYRDGGDGRTQLLMSATAKNGFGLELGYDVQCDFHGADLDNFVMSEASE